MLCPEVSSFPLKRPLKVKQGKHVDLATAVKIVLPNESSVNRLKSLKEDAEFYSVKGRNVAEFFRQDFLRHFVVDPKGKLTLMAANLLVRDDRILMTVEKSLLDRLGLGEFRVCGRNHDDLALLEVKGQTLLADGRRRRVWMNAAQEIFEDDEEIRFIWRPKNHQICPSSVAKFLHDSNIQVEEISVQEVDLRRFRGPFARPNLDSDRLEDVENWVGSLLLDVDPQSVGIDLEEDENEGHLGIYEFRGLFDVEKLIEIRNEMSQKLEFGWAIIIASLDLKLPAINHKNLSKNDEVKQMQRSTEILFKGRHKSLVTYY